MSVYIILTHTSHIRCKVQIYIDTSESLVILNKNLYSGCIGTITQKKKFKKFPLLKVHTSCKCWSYSGGSGGEGGGGGASPVPVTKGERE